MDLEIFDDGGDHVMVVAHTERGVALLRDRYNDAQYDERGALVLPSALTPELRRLAFIRDLDVGEAGEARADHPLEAHCAAAGGCVANRLCHRAGCTLPPGRHP